MNENQTSPTNLLDTTDCLEAVAVFRSWKNLLFVVMILCLILLQASFWSVNLGIVKTDQQAETAEPAAAEQIDAEAEQIDAAAKQVAAEPNQPAEAAIEEKKPEKNTPAFTIKFNQLAWLIRVLDFLLIPTSILYCLTMLFALKISLIGRLGGINHISRAFFCSLVFVVLLLPWQKFFGGVVVGAMYTPKELLDAFSTVCKEGCGFFAMVSYYSRFTAYWLLVVLLLVRAHFRSARWSKTILRRLEII